MTRQLYPRSPLANRGHTLLTNEKSALPRGKRRAGEIAGGAAAECAAVCCCCPCALMNLLVLVVYKVPYALYKKAVHKRKRQRLQKKKKMWLQQNPSIAAGDNVTVTLEEHLSVEVDKESADAAVELEKEMWARFHGTGFWRSPSQRQSP